MKHFFLFFLFSIVATSQVNFNKNALIGWCVVPDDSERRTPKERLEMLNEIGIKHYIYDWIPKSLSTFDQEIKLSKTSPVKIDGVWLYIDERFDKIGKLSENNLKAIQIVRNNDFRTTFWVGFHHNFYDNLTPAEQIKKGSQMIQFISKLIGSSNIALYGRGENDWFGEPQNQIEIIKRAKIKNLKIIYNFHHAHSHINRFKALLDSMMPYLECINLNGMDMEKSKFLTIGKGKYEAGLIKIIRESGYTGKIGILGHRSDRDVKDVLQENMQGLEKILAAQKQ